MSRTIEALDLALQTGAITVAVTGSRKTPLANVANIVLETAVPPLNKKFPGLIVPGTRSYYASQFALYTLAIHIGRQRNHLTETIYNELQIELLSTAALIEANDFQVRSNHLPGGSIMARRGQLCFLRIWP